jgi:hypothetical protein
LYRYIVLEAGAWGPIPEALEFRRGFSYGWQQFIVSPAAPVEFGWRVSEIAMFRDPECQMQLDKEYFVNVVASGLYPNPGWEDGRLHVVENIYDNNTNTDWWSLQLQNSGMEPPAYDTDMHNAHGPSWITWFVEPGVECVRITQVEGHAAARLRVERLTTLSAGCEDGCQKAGLFLARAPVHPTSQTYSMADQWTKPMSVDILIICGMEDFQLFGEMLFGGEETDAFPPTSADAGHFRVPRGHYRQVPTPCNCQRLCIDHKHLGCESWKWYRETQHCILQRSFATKTGRLDVCRGPSCGRGWHDAPEGLPFPGWVSGTSGLIVEGATLSAPDEKGMRTLSITGKGLGKEELTSRAAEQRAKLVDGTDCGAPVAAGVAGIVCSSNQLCSPGPAADSTPRSGNWPVRVASGAATRQLGACYCPYDCDDYLRWQLAGVVDVPPSPYVWSMDSAVTVTRELDGGAFDIVVKRPPESSAEDVSQWSLKLVSKRQWTVQLGECVGRETFEVSGAVAVDGDSAKFSVGVRGSAGLLLQHEDIGDWSVCLKTGPGATSVEIPSDSGSYVFTVHATPYDALPPRGIFRSTEATVEAGSSAIVSVLAERLLIPGAYHVGIGADCSSQLTNLSQVPTNDGFDVHLAANESDVQMVEEICVCDPFAADSHVSSVGSRSYERRERAECVGTQIAPASEFSGDVCQTKCKTGCIGADCKCDAWQEADETTLCIGAESCMEACELDGGCGAFDYDEIRGHCRLFTACDPDPVKSRSGFRVRFEAQADTAACVDGGFQPAARVTITPTVRLAEYVVAPKQPLSLEIAAAKESLLHGCSSDHRVYVTYAGGVCGKANPVEDLHLAPGSPEITSMDSGSISTWASWAPLGRIDQKGDIVEGLAMEHRDPEGLGGVARMGAGYHYQANHTKDSEFTSEPGGYCPTNMPVSALPERLQVHACHKKCANSRDQQGDCLGYVHGPDAHDEEVLCVSQALCQFICASVDACNSIEMHNHLPRCYLNSEHYCASDYVPPIYAEGPVTFIEDVKFTLQKLVPRPAGSLNRPAMAPADTGYSYPQLLRFAPITFPQGGEYTLCFCDAKASAKRRGRACEEVGDYAVRVGTVHVSGVSCLLADRNLARATCVPNYAGGQSSLRCYDGPAPQFEIPKEGPCVPSRTSMR